LFAWALFSIQFFGFIATGRFHPQSSLLSADKYQLRY
jgi:hypothetical protein